MKKIRIINDTGIGRGTKVFDNDGNDLTERLPIKKCVVTIAVNELNRVELELIATELDIEVPAIFRRKLKLNWRFGSLRYPRKL